MYRLIYKFVEPNQNLGHKVRVRHIDGFGSSSMFSPREFQFGANVGSNSVRFDSRLYQKRRLFSALTRSL